jgi:precorrin-3B methylase
MRGMQFSLPFKGSAEQGVVRLKQLLDEHRDQVARKATDVQEEWNGNVLSFAFTAEGKRIEGTVTVSDGAYNVYAKLPLMMRMFEGTIERMIQSEVKKLNLDS